MRLVILVSIALIGSAFAAEKKPASKTASKTESETPQKHDTPAASKSGAKTGTKTPTKEEPKPPVKGSPKSASKQQTKPIAKGDSKPASKSEPKPTAKSDSKPAQKSESKIASKSKTKTSDIADTKASPKEEEKSQPPVLDDAGDTDARGPTAANASLRPEEIAGFDGNPEKVQQIIRTALDLTRRDLTYRFGSSDPKSGGMDCSGTIYYTLREAGFNPPRDSSGMYLWAKNAGTLREVEPTSLEDAPSLRGMRPGDLMFWEGTYNVQRTPPISHVMIYLGKEKVSGTPVMVGASDGRTYRGTRRNGVSVFDFKLPRAESKARFVGYARVPEA